MKLAIIPARGGSKRIPRKNVQPFRGKPIIGYAIQAALDSGCFDEVMVSTEDPEIAEIAKSYGAKVPFLRGDHSASDTAPTGEVIREVLNAYLKQGHSFDIACCLYPTAALVTPHRIRQAAQMLADNPQAEGIITVVRNSQPAVRAFVLREGWVEFMLQEQRQTRSQDFDTTYFDAAQMYWLRPEPFLSQPLNVMAGLKRLPLVLSEFETQDINTWDDWRLAEWKHLFLEEHPEILHEGTLSA